MSINMQSGAVRRLRARFFGSQTLFCKDNVKRLFSTFWLVFFLVLVSLPLMPSSVRADDPYSGGAGGSSNPGIAEIDNMTTWKPGKFLNAGGSELDRQPTQPSNPSGHQAEESPGKSISGALGDAFTAAIRFLRTVLLFFLLIYTLFVGVGMAFGQAGMNEVLSLVLGIIFFAGAGAVATIYHLLFF